MPGHDETAGREERIAEIIAVYLESLEAGEKPSQEEVLARYPQFETDLREFFDNERFLRSAFSSDDPLPSFGDDYDVHNEIGRGGMGIVYKVHQQSLDKIVAIKTITKGPFATPAAIERIRKEAQRAARLRHPHIVTVHQVAEYQGQHFFVMEYIEGQSLAALVGDKPLPVTQAAEYVRTIADAIHYAHQRQILHCDLKPANILLDEHGKPCVSDFGLAKRLGENARYLPTSAGGGSPGYMAPEQVVGSELTTATDVYGLGGILYKLVTGSSPFQARTVLETLKMVREELPLPPGERNPDVDKDLEAICLKCLNKDKDQRYGSAYGLARELDRYLAGEETSARRWSGRKRSIQWCRRNPLAAGLVSAVVVISILTLSMALSTAQARKRAQLQEALQSNSFAARDLARTALLQLRDLSDVVEEAARDAAIPEMFGKQDDGGLQLYTERICRADPVAFATCTALNADGIQIARHDESGQETGPTRYDFAWRDYFSGTKDHDGLQGRSSVHISRVYRSQIDDRFKFALSAPVIDGGRRLRGVITTLVTTDAAMGRVILEDSRRKVALIAPRDIDGPEMVAQNQSGKAVIVFHPGYHRGVEAVQFPDASPMIAHTESAHANELDDSKVAWPPVDDYQDPVASIVPEYRGRWIAGFAPVGNTGFVIIVQQRYDEALQLDPSTSRNLILWSAGVIAAGIFVFLVLWRRVRPSKMG